MSVEPVNTAKPSSRESRPTVALFVTCMVDALYPHTGLAAADLLERGGARVIFPSEQTCCGQPAYNAGHRAPARALALHFIDVFWPLLDRGDIQAIVAPSGSCVAMVRHSYQVLFEHAEQQQTRTRVRQLSRVTYELTEYLVDVLRADARESSFHGTIAYHPCCHLLRDLRVDAQPRRLLADVADATVVDLPAAEDCCGFGGLFAVRNEPISVAMGKQKARNLDACGADVVVMNDAGCIAHMNGLLERGGHRCRAVHIAALLRQPLESREPPS